MELLRKTPKRRCCQVEQISQPFVKIAVPGLGQLTETAFLGKRPNFSAASRGARLLFCLSAAALGFLRDSSAYAAFLGSSCELEYLSCRITALTESGRKAFPFVPAVNLSFRKGI